MIPRRRSSNGVSRTRVAMLGIAAALTIGAASLPAFGAASVRLPTFPIATELTASFPYGLVQGEPNIKSDAAGNLYVMAAASTPIGCELWRLPAGALTPSFLGAPDDGAGGGDCDIALSPDVPAGQSGQTLAYSSLTLPDITVGSSTDAGTTFSTPNPAGSQIVADDRQWLAAAGGNTFYMSSHIVASDNIAVSRSTDGGRTYSFVGLAIDNAHIAQAAYNNELGPLVVDVTSTLSPKPLYTIFSAPSTVTANLNSAAGTTQSSNNALYLASSFDGGSTWNDTPIYVEQSDQTVDHIFPTLSIDSGGMLWAAWSTNSHIYVSHATTRQASTLLSSWSSLTSTDAVGQLVPETFVDLGSQSSGTLPWSNPVQLDPAGTTANVFAWVTGGGGNRADVVYYSGTGSGTGPDDTTARWVVRYAQLHETNKGLVVTSAVASDHVMHIGQICETGVTCSVNGNRDLLDFLEVTITPDGRAAIAWTDDTAAPPAGQIYVAEQCAGVSQLSGANLTNTC
jgi:hypothetical protein